MTQKTAWKPEADAALRKYLESNTLSDGLGDRQSACSIAAINIALTGELTDEIPQCMSRVIGEWILSVQDHMRADDRNSRTWKNLLPEAAASGRGRENQILALLINATIERTRPALAPVAARAGVMDAWRQLRTGRGAADAALRAAVRAIENADQRVEGLNSLRASAFTIAQAIEEARSRPAFSARLAGGSLSAAADASGWKTLDPSGLLGDLIAEAKPGDGD